MICPKTLGVTLEGMLAIYAAVVGTAALIWQIVIEVRRRRTQVEVRLEEGMKGPRIAVVNRSEHPVRVVAGGLQANDAPSVGEQPTPS